MKYLLPFLFLALSTSCAYRKPLGEASKTVFAQQSTRGTSENAASRLTSEEARTVLGEQRGSPKRPGNQDRSFNIESKEPLNNDFSSGIN